MRLFSSVGSLLSRLVYGIVSGMSSTSLVIRKLAEEDLVSAFPIIVQLRPKLSYQRFQSQVEKQARAGYVLFGAFATDGRLLGVMGMRPVTTLARGDHLHIDDLVVSESVRGTGVGKALLGFAERWAMEHGLQAVFLDSRPEAIGFYSALGYTPHTSTLMKKYLAVQ